MNNRTNDLQEMAAELAQRNEELRKEVESRRQLEQELLQTKETAEAAIKTRSAFLAAMSHEFRTPLNSILGFSGLLQEKALGPLTDEQAGYVGMIASSGQHLLRMINDSLDIARIEAGKMELTVADSDVGALLQETISLMNNEAALNCLSLRSETAPNLAGARLKVDERKIKQILLNLLSNAIKFTPEGGSVVVASWLADGQLVVRVSDTGIGIDPKDQDRIFGQFERIEQADGKNRPGTGLGLALTRKLVEMHGGKISLVSEGFMKGCAFTFSIPGQAAATAAKHVPALAVELNVAEEQVRQCQEFGRDKPLVLVVEDDRKSRQLLAEYLRLGGYDTVFAVDGDEGVRLALEYRPWAIILDFILPKKNGLQALAEIRRHPETRETPVVFVSMAERHEAAFALGAIEWLVKPVARQRLNDVLERAAAERGHPRLKVLIIDGEESRDGLINAAKERNYDVLDAYSGRHGVQLARAIRTDFIVVDLFAPEMDGFDVVATLRGAAETRDIPIAVFTDAELSAEDKTRLLRCARTILPKVAKEQLLDVLQQTFQAKKAR
jgi:signal transduction histidine kinase/DNA-binding response OmpR family regulator